MVSVAPQIGGEIQEFLAEPGQEVYEGELLARISSQGLKPSRKPRPAPATWRKPG